jgi:hypothetical protein
MNNAGYQGWHDRYTAAERILYELTDATSRRNGGTSSSGTETANMIRPITSTSTCGTTKGSCLGSPFSYEVRTYKKHEPSHITYCSCFYVTDWVNLICFVAVGLPLQQDNTKFDHREMPYRMKTTAFGSSTCTCVMYANTQDASCFFFICFCYIEVDACLTTGLYWSHKHAGSSREINKRARGGADGHSISSWISFFQFAEANGSPLPAPWVL